MSWGEYGSDICVCGDYRCQHVGDGKCRVCGIGMAPWNCCSKFKLSHHADDEDMKSWRLYHQQREALAATEPKEKA